MSFTDQKPRIVSEEDLKIPWAGNPKNFRCYMCGYRLKLGDYWRWVFTNDVKGAGGNPIVCKDCDGEDVVERWREMHQEAQNKFWWFTKG